MPVNELKKPTTVIWTDFQHRLNIFNDLLAEVLCDYSSQPQPVMESLNTQIQRSSDLRLRLFDATSLSLNLPSGVIELGNNDQMIKG
jgi:hypothetical protein